MTKQELQQELRAKLKEGIKPSMLKKSKSTGDLKKAQTEPLSRSLSAPKSEPTANSKELIEQLETKISVLELQLETSQRELAELNAYKENNSFLTQENTHLKEQNKNKQKDLENSRQELEEIRQELNSLKSEQSNLLDQNLTLKHQGLKDWFQQYEQTCKIEKELSENIEYASSELVKQDRQISGLQGQVNKLKQEKQSLEKDLNLAHKLVELRKEPYFEASPSLTHFQYALYALLAIWFLLILRRKNV